MFILIQFIVGLPQWVYFSVSHYGLQLCDSSCLTRSILTKSLPLPLRLLNLELPSSSMAYAILTRPSLNAMKMLAGLFLLLLLNLNWSFCVHGQGFEIFYPDLFPSNFTNVFLMKSFIPNINWGTLSNKTIAIFGRFVLYAIYKVRAWVLHLALVRRNDVDTFGLLMHLWSCDLAQGL